MIRGTAQVEKEDDIQLTLTVTMSVGEWREVMRQLPTDRYPGYRLSIVVANVIGHYVSRLSEKFETHD